MPELSKTLTQQLSFQTYGAGPQLEGVWRQALKKHRSENGAFLELARLKDGTVEGLPAPFRTQQVNVSWAHPRRINAFHLHPKVPQNELWTVIAGQLKVWLVDCRAGSATEGGRQQLILSGEEPALVHIPAGVAHGYQAGTEGATLLYLMDQPFDPADPNEGRLPWDAFGASLWDEDRG